MSEEQLELETEHESNGTTGAKIISVIALVFSIAALILSSIPYLNNVGVNLPVPSVGAKKEVKISTQYDRGKSLDKARATKKPIVVFFYTDWCGFCQRFAPTYDKITKDREIKKNFAVAYVNCEKPENEKDVAEYGIQGFPTVFVIKEDGERVQLENGTFFNDDSVKVVKDKMLEIIGK